ncbi:AAA family ATPase [Streptomyces aureus]|uniref:AAA family ATPase n=1 Tax=Streptomyces aureus TaxID=193461 RepID=UPI0006E38BED|nr:AAA family ATPase [Streptomyces aureus]
MPLTEPQWDIVTEWVGSYLLDNIDPHAALRAIGFDEAFIKSVSLTGKSGENAVGVVTAITRRKPKVRLQFRLVDGLIRQTQVGVLGDTAPLATEFRDVLQKDLEHNSSEESHYRSTVLEGGAEVFIDRAELRQSARRLVDDPRRMVLLVDGAPNSGRSYTFSYIRHLSHHCEFTPVRVVLSRTSTAAEVLQQLATWIAPETNDPRNGLATLNATQLNCPQARLQNDANSVVRWATASEERFWLVFDECDQLDVNSDVWDCIGMIARAIYGNARPESAPRLVLLGHSPSMPHLPHEIRNYQCWDTARVLEEEDLRRFFNELFTGSPEPPGPSPDVEGVAALVDAVVSEVLRAARGPGEDSYMRRICTAAEAAVRVHQSLDSDEEFIPRLRAELQAEHAEQAPPVSELRQAYREAACLLSHFDPERLRLAGETAPSGNAALELDDDCLRVGTADHPLWVLKPEVREATLRGLSGPEAALRALAANLSQEAVEAVLLGTKERELRLRRTHFSPPPAGSAARPDSHLTETRSLAYLVGSPPPLEGQNTTELTDTLQAVLWLSQVPGTTGLPDPDDVQQLMERARLLQPLELLLRGPVHGRTAELNELRAYVGLAVEEPHRGPVDPGQVEPDGPVDPGQVEPDGQVAAGRPPARPKTPIAPGDLVPARALPQAPPLLVHGLAGIGKSTLLAKFLLDSLRDHRHGFPFAYVDFDRPTISINEPATLIAELARQFGVQFPHHRDAFDALARECEETVGALREEEEEIQELYGLSATRSTLGRSSSAEFHAQSSARETELARRVAALVVEAVAVPAGEPGPPLVILVDSFEDAQYRGSPMVGRMWAVWAALQEVYPRLRFIVSGSASVPHPGRLAELRTMELRELEPEAAVALLVFNGVEDETVARALVERVGGHPLSLKLAARAALLAGDEAGATGGLIEQLPDRRRGLHRAVDQMLVQGILYDRILRHIVDDEVRRLAEAALALRTITPELIQDVLAEACEIEVAGPEHARHLFRLLSRLDLVEAAGPGAVRHRADLRAIMLRLADRNEIQLTKAVDRLAVTYYRQLVGLEARAEEIYHRLRRNESPREVEKRWLPGVERFLAGAGKDMAPRAAAFLAARMGGHIPETDLAEADQEDWERLAAREVEDLLAQGFVDAAAVRLSERRPWTPGSRLHPLLVETLARQGRLKEARAEAEAAVDRAEEGSQPELQLELLPLAARLAEEEGDIHEAEFALDEAEDVATRIGRDFEAMGARLARARLTAASPEADTEAGAKLARQLRSMPAEQLNRNSTLVRLAAAQVCKQDPKALEHTLEVVGLPASEDAVPDTLADAIRRAAADQPQLHQPLRTILESAAGPPERGEAAATPPADAPPTGTAGILREAQRHGTLDELARRLLQVKDQSGELLSGVAAAMGASTPVPGPAAGRSVRPVETPGGGAVRDTGPTSPPPLEGNGPQAA